MAATFSRDGLTVAVLEVDDGTAGSTWVEPQKPCHDFIVVERREVVEVSPDIAKLSRADRRAMMAIAKRYGWKIKDSRKGRAK